MNTLKESLFSSSNSTSKTKRTRQNHSKTNKLLQENNGLSEPLLSASETGNNNIELGMIDTDDDDDDKQSKTQQIIRSRTSKRQPTPSIVHGGGSIVIVEKPILPNETIQAFAIRYRVPVSQLKRINNLQNDQDFYALTHCRVPVRRFGVLHESSSPPIVVNLNDQLLTNASSSITNLSQQNHIAFLNAMDNDLASMRTKVEHLLETPTATLIPDQPTTKMMIRTTKPIGELNCDGADCGCKLWHIVMVIILIALLAPLVYVYIFVKHPPIRTEHFP